MKQVIDIKNFTIEKVSSVILMLLGTFFLILALTVAWMYLFNTSICFAAAILVRDLKDGKDISKRL